MDGQDSEACGRCTMTSVVDATGEETDERTQNNPFDGARIELDDTELRTASIPAVAAGRVKRRLDELAMRFVYDR